MRINKFHIWFLVLAFVSLTLGLLYKTPSSFIEINVHDNYYIILTAHIYYFFGFAFLAMGLLHWVLLKVKLVKWLRKFHFFVSLVLFIVLSGSIIFFKNQSENPDFPIFDSFFTENTIHLASISIFVCLQIVFVLVSSVGLAISLFFKLKNKL